MNNNANSEKLLNKMEEVINSDFQLSRMIHKQVGNISYYEPEYLLSCVFHTWMIRKDVAMNRDDFLKHLFIDYGVEMPVSDFLEMAQKRICSLIEAESGGIA